MNHVKYTCTCRYMYKYVCTELCNGLELYSKCTMEYLALFYYSGSIHTSCKKFRYRKSSIKCPPQVSTSPLLSAPLWSRFVLSTFTRQYKFKSTSLKVHVYKFVQGTSGKFDNNSPLCCFASCFCSVAGLCSSGNCHRKGICK